MLLTGKSILKRWEKKYKIPYEYLKFKCTRDFLQGIQCKAYTEKQAESLENAILWDHVKENYNKKRRIKRGLFQSLETLINSDVNGAYQIIKKVFPNAFSYGIEACLTPTIINACLI